MQLLLHLLAVVSLVIWLGLWLAHAGFWRVDRGHVPPPPPFWPPVTAVIPARNEEAVIGETLRSLWAQGYPGRLRIVVVDDHSDDATAATAMAAAEKSGHAADLTVLSAEALPPGWAGKVWAMEQGRTRGLRGDDAPYILLTDADVSHGAGSLAELVSRAEAGSIDLTSFMIRLRCVSPAERLMIPAFVFFFQLLYPFRRVNDPTHPLAGAAGGMMLLRRTALERIGGLVCIRKELIDDCSLAREVKRGGHRLWLGLSDNCESTRGYGTLGEIVRMIARTAYTQLGYSPLALAGCVLGLALTFLAPPMLTVLARGWDQALGGTAWLVMALLYLPMLRFYHRSPMWAPLLPVTALLYLWATMASAYRHHRGLGGQWKGRTQSSDLAA